jgi:uncharacterized membrane protein YccF (DUF307 family)
MNLILNILWLVLGGVWMAAGWLVAALIFAVTIIGLPWARSALTMAGLALLPFGQGSVNRRSVRGEGDLGTGPLGVIGNLVWLVVAGWWLALGHVISAVLLALTIIGLPFAWAHLKLARLALWPVGQTLQVYDSAAPPVR